MLAGLSLPLFSGHTRAPIRPLRNRAFLAYLPHPVPVVAFPTPAIVLPTRARRDRVVLGVMWWVFSTWRTRRINAINLCYYSLAVLLRPRGERKKGLAHRL
eukprot:COSAG01_NODE_32216_length_584_cov_2.892784_1_plen_100_part_10